MRNILLLRHAESEKNSNLQFASKDGMEALTNAGIRSSEAIASDFRDFERATGRKIGLVASSISQRSTITASIIAKALGCKKTEITGLESIGSGFLAGVSEVEAWRVHPGYMKALELYRAGLYNSYDIPEFEGKEDKKVFERRVSAALDAVVLGTELDLVIVAQRSPITAILLRVAREFYRYPKDFFGHIQLDLGRVSWISSSPRAWTIHAVNLSTNLVATRALEELTHG
jgi:broad specificity phosphatase PhoE